MADHKALVRAIVEGNREQFRILVEEFQRLVSHFVFRMVRDPHDREDVCQEVFIKVYQNLASFRHDSKLSTWVGQIAYNTCLSFLAKKQLPSFDDVVSSEDDSTSGGFASESARPDRQYEAANMSTSIMHEIDRLPVLPGAVLTLFHLEQMTIQEISDIMKIPRGTVKSHLFRARKLLRDRLTSRYQWKEA